MGCININDIHVAYRHIVEVQICTSLEETSYDTYTTEYYVSVKTSAGDIHRIECGRNKELADSTLCRIVSNL